MEVILKEVEVNKISLQPEEVLLVKCKGEDFSEQFIQSFGKELKSSFPNNKIHILLLNSGHDIVFEKASSEGDNL